MVAALRYTYSLLNFLSHTLLIGPVQDEPLVFYRTHFTNYSVVHCFLYHSVVLWEWLATMDGCSYNDGHITGRRREEGV